MSKKKAARSYRLQDDAQELADANLWTLPYANLMTILMIFFLILYSFATTANSTHYEKVLMAIKSSVKEKKDRGREEELLDKITDYSSKYGLKSFVNVDVDAKRIRITMANPILFKLGSSRLQPAIYPFLDELSGFLKNVPNLVVVDGHTDDIPIHTARFRSNWELSAERSFSVIEYLIKKGNLDPQRFSALGYGEFLPLVPNKSAAHRARNRRVEISILRSYDEKG